jgi:hypothetical protein
MTEENALSASSVGVILGNAKARKELLLLKIKEAAIGKVLDENASKELQASIKLGNAKAAEAKLQRELDASKKNLDPASDKIRKQEIALSFASKATKELQKDYDALRNITVNYSNQLDPLIGRVAEINSETQKSIQTAKADADAKNKQAEASKKLATANKEVELTVEQLAAAQIAKNLKESQVRQLVEREAMKGTPQTNFDRQVVSAGDTAGAVTSFQGSPIAQGLLDEAAAAAAARTEYEKYAESVSTLVAPAIDQLFTAFEQGKNIFQALGDTIKSLVIDIAKAIIKATILKAITTAVSAGSGAGIFGGLFNAIAGGLGGVAAPSFGGGASLGGGLALNGQVVFVQRGTDLVGVLNKGNSQINRVG